MLPISEWDYCPALQISAFLRSRNCIGSGYLNLFHYCASCLDPHLLRWVARVVLPFSSLVKTRGERWGRPSPWQRQGLPWCLRGEESTSQFRRFRFDPWAGKTPWRRKWQPAPVYLPGKSHGQRSLVGYSPRDCERIGRDLATKQGAEAREIDLWVAFGWTMVSPHMQS